MSKKAQTEFMKVILLGVGFLILLVVAIATVIRLLG